MILSLIASLNQQLKSECEATSPTINRTQDAFSYLGQSAELERCEGREVCDRILFAPVICTYLAVFSELLIIREGVRNDLPLP